MDKIFASKPGRKRFLTTIISILLTIMIIRLAIFPISYLSNSFNETIVSFLDKATTSIFTAVIVGFFLYWVQADEQRKSVEFTESGHEIEKQLNCGRQSTNFWYFNGGLGRYTKSDTLPRLSDIAIREARSIAIKMVVLDPLDDLLLNNYIGFKNTVEYKEGKWTVLNVRSEIISTIISALLFESRNTFLTIDIRLKSFFTLSRMDISSKLIVITREDPSIPSQVLREGSYLYKHYIEEFFQVYRQSRVLSNYGFPIVDKLNNTHIQDCLKFIFPGMTFEEDLVNMVVEMVTTPKNPFNKA